MTDLTSHVRIPSISKKMKQESFGVMRDSLKCYMLHALKQRLHESFFQVSLDLEKIETNKKNNSRFFLAKTRLVH